MLAKYSIISDPDKMYFRELRDKAKYDCQPLNSWWVCLICRGRMRRSIIRRRNLIELSLNNSVKNTTKQNWLYPVLWGRHPSGRFSSQYSCHEGSRTLARPFYFANVALEM